MKKLEDRKPYKRSLTKIFRSLFLVLLLIILVACNWGHKQPDEVRDERNKNRTQVDSAFNISKMPHGEKTGVGPIKEEVELGLSIDKEMAEKGEELFNTKCATCHQIHESSTGPALGGVLEKRSPQWVMNMILNPHGMVKSDPQARALKAVYETQMVDLDLSKEEAREIVEYLRKY